jgi:ankyrin repeat protein
MKINDWEKCFQLLSKNSLLETDVNCADESSSTPLLFASMNDNLQLVTLLIAKDAKVDS